MSNLYHLFPRQVAYPFRITVGKHEFFKTINLLNGKKRVFSSIYNYTGNYEYDKLALVVDKVFFDFDGPESLPHTLALIEECISNNYKFMPFFSGNGFHVYVFTNKKQLKNPKYALTRFQKKFSGMDSSSIGDIARVATIPNTFNTKRGRFCIPVSIEDIKSGFDYVSNKASNQCFDYKIYGSINVNLEDGEYECDYKTYAFDEPKIIVRKLDNIPPCINDMLSYKKKGFRGRYLIITYLKDAFYLEYEIENIIKEYCSETEAKHCIVDEKQIKHLYWNEIMFPSCETIKHEGKCPCEGFCEYTREYGNKHLVKIYK